MSLLMKDVRSRRVVRVGVGYLLGSVALVVGLSLMGGVVPMPDWTVRMVGGAAFVILPFVLVLIWALEDQGPETVKPLRRR